MPIISTTWRLRATSSGRGADALGEQRDRLGVEPVGLGEPAGGAGEGADPVRVDDGERQPGAGERGGDGDLEAAGGLEHD
jgi:hypothetical protein